MTRPRLLDQIEEIEFSAGAHDLFRHLTGFSAADEEAAVILVAAAVLLARQFAHPDDAAPLDDLAGQFRDVVFAARDRIHAGRCRPTLHVVGDSESHSYQKEA